MKAKNNLIKLTLSVLLIGFLFTSCKKNDSDDNDQIAGSKHLNPPAWIQGTWIDLTQPNMRTGYQFTVDDMKTIIGSNTVSVKASLKSTDNISENTTATSYRFTITHTATNNSTETWEFNKIDATHIQTIHGSVTATLTKE